MIKKYFFLFIGILIQLLSTSVKAQHDATNSKSLLWKISGNGITKPSYLFGTIHMICKEDYFFTDKMKDAFNQSEELILEINLADEKTITQYQQSMMLPEGTLLKNFFKDEKAYDAFAEKVKQQLSLDVSLFQSLKPIILLSVIAQKSFACANTSSYEMSLIEMSKAEQKEIAGLETTLAQMKIFDEMSNADIEKILVSGVDDIANDNLIQQQMIKAYKNQDIEKLHNIIAASKEFVNHQDVLLYNRNKDWAEKLPEMMKSKSCFIAVGAGHLGGKKGVISLLRKIGYKVEPVVN